MDKIDSHVNAGDYVIFRAKNGKWIEGWKVTATTKNKYGVVEKVTVVDGKAKRKLDLFKDVVHVLPPYSEVEPLVKLLQEDLGYTNLRVIRRRGTSPPSYIPLCIKCKDTLRIIQSTEEGSEVRLDLRVGDPVISQSKPYIVDVEECVKCSCTDSYDIIFDPH